MASSKRSKTFATLFYLENLSSNSDPDESLNALYLQDLLRGLHVSFLVSPCHSKDIKEDGTFKKAHYHVILIFDSLKSVPQVKEIMEELNLPFVGLEIVNSLTSYARYLIHLDDPEKFQYPVTNVLSYGIDYQELIRKRADKYSDYSCILDIVVSKHITSFAALLLWAKDNDKAIFNTLCDNSYTIREFIRSYVADCNKSGTLKIK